MAKREKKEVAATKRAWRENHDHFWGGAERGRDQGRVERRGV